MYLVPAKNWDLSVNDALRICQRISHHVMQYYISQAENPPVKNILNNLAVQIKLYFNSLLYEVNQKPAYKNNKLTIKSIKIYQIHFESIGINTINMIPKPHSIKLVPPEVLRQFILELVQAGTQLLATHEVQLTEKDELITTIPPHHLCLDGSSYTNDEIDFERAKKFLCEKLTQVLQVKETDVMNIDFAEVRVKVSH